MKKVFARALTAACAAILCFSTTLTPVYASVLTEEEAADYRRKLLEYQQGAMRTLAFACREHLPESSLTPSHPSAHATFLGIAAISDPVRSDVPLAVDECQRAGIDIKIVTGDTTATAIAIARQIGIR